MKKYEAIEMCIAKKDIKALRAKVGSLCYTCRDFSDGEFDEMVKYIEKKGLKLVEDHLIGNPTISSQKTTFTDEDFADAVFELKKNFCQERISDVKTIGKKLYGTQKPEGKNGQASQGESRPKGESHQPKQEWRKIVLIGVVAIVAVIVLVLLIKNKMQA